MQYIQVTAGQEHQPRHDNCIPRKAVQQIYKDKCNFGRKKLHKRIKVIFLEALLAMETMQEPQSNLEEQSQHFKRLFFLGNRPIHFYINGTRIIRPVKLRKLIFSNSAINEPLPAQVYSVSQVRFRSQLYLLPQIRCLIIDA